MHVKSLFLLYFIFLSDYIFYYFSQNNWRILGVWADYSLLLYFLIKFGIICGLFKILAGHSAGFTIGSQLSEEKKAGNRYSPTKTGWGIYKLK